MQTRVYLAVCRFAIAASLAVLTGLTQACDGAYGEDWAFEATTPELWPSKCGKDSPMPGTVAFMWPLGSRADQATTFMYVTVSKKTIPTLEEYATAEQQRYRRQVPNAQVHTLAVSYQRADQRVMAFELSLVGSARRELIAYVEGPTSYFIIVLTAMTLKDLELNRRSFFSYVASFTPKVPVPLDQQGRRFEVTSIALYQPDSVLRERVGPDAGEFAKYLKALEAAAEAVFASVSRTKGVTGSIVVALKPGGLSRFWLVLGSNKLPEGLRETLLQGLASVPPLPVANGPVAAALNFNAWGGGQPILAPGEPVPIPEEWRAAVTDLSPGVLPDSPLKIVWP